MHNKFNTAVYIKAMYTWNVAFSFKYIKWNGKKN